MLASGLQFFLSIDEQKNSMHVQSHNVFVHVRGSILTDNDCQDDENNDDENDPQLHILPPQLALQTSCLTLKHAGTLPHQI